MTDVKISNIEQSFRVTEIKEVCKDFTTAICSMEIKNAPPEVSNAIRRVLKNEKLGFRFEVDQENIKTTSNYMNLVEVQTNIMMAPVRYDLTEEELDIELYIDYTNTTKDVLAVTFGDLKYRGKKPSYMLTYSTIELVYLNPGDRVQITGIHIVEGKDHAAFCDVVACSSYPLDRERQKGMFAYKDKTSISNPMHHKLLFEVPTARPNHKNLTNKFVALACDIILRRLDNMIYVVKENVVEIDKGQDMLIFTIEETNTIAKLLERFLVTMHPSLKSVESIVTYPDNLMEFSLYINNAEDVYYSTINTCKEIFKSIKTQVSNSKYM